MDTPMKIWLGIVVFFICIAVLSFPLLNTQSANANKVFEYKRGKMENQLMKVGVQVVEATGVNTKSVPVRFTVKNFDDFLYHVQKSGEPVVYSQKAVGVERKQYYYLFTGETVYTYQLYVGLFDHLEAEGYTE